MNMLGSSTFLLSLMSTAASLPFFPFTPPAGVFADMVNRRKLLCFVNLWLAAAAGFSSIILSFPLVSLALILFGVFLTGGRVPLHRPPYFAVVAHLVAHEVLAPR